MEASRVLLTAKMTQIEKENKWVWYHTKVVCYYYRQKYIVQNTFTLYPHAKKYIFKIKL